MKSSNTDKTDITDKTDLMYTNSILYKELSDEILHWFYEVYNTLGYGFLEKVYKNSLFFDLCNVGLNCEVEKQIDVYYKNKCVGVYYADIIVENKIILELKAKECICKEHEYQLSNYLRATNYEIGYVLNFGKKPEFKRVILTNDRK